MVFSHFRASLDRIRSALQDAGFTVYMLAGASGPQRHGMIRDFQTSRPEDTTPRVFLVSTSIGAVGITLTAANLVVMMEPAMDPASELQAAGRVHRLGQTRSVSVRRLVANNTVEQRIATLHARVKAGTIKTSSTGCGLPEAALKLLFDEP